MFHNCYFDTFLFIINLVERHVFFQTIKMGEEIRKLDLGTNELKPPGYHTFYQEGRILLIADVLPFHIVDGHISTSLSPTFFDLLLANMETEGMISEMIRLKFNQSHGLASSDATNYMKLTPRMNGSSLYGEGRAAVNRITHIYLLCKIFPGPPMPFVEADFITMTLVVEKESE
jgi:hypothetical protein